MSSDNWNNTTFYNQDVTNSSIGSLNANNISSSLKLSDYHDSSVAEKGIDFAVPKGGNKKMIPEKPGCKTEWKWDWKCGSSNDINSSNPQPLKPIGSNVKWFDDSTSTQMVVDDELFNSWQVASDIDSVGKPSPGSIPLYCINQSRLCDVRLHLDDFGILTIRRLKPDNDEDEILWRSHTSTTSQLPEDAIPHELYIPSNASNQNIGRPRTFTGRERMGLTTRDSGLLASKVHSLSTPQTPDTPGDQTARNNSIKAAQDMGRSFLFANDKITKGTWLSSPNGMCRLTLNDANELIVEYYTSKCGDLQSTEVLDVHEIDIVNNPTKIGKMGYVDGLGILHEFPDAPLDATGNAFGFGSTYWGKRTHEEEESVNKYTYFDDYTLGTTNSRPNQTTTATNRSECETWCTADKLCAAYSFNPKATPASKCNIVSLPSGATTLETVYTKGGTYAVRSKKIIGGHSSVPIDISPINVVSNTFWNNYSILGKTGAAMTADTIGGLAEATLNTLNAYTAPPLPDAGQDIQPSISGFKGGRESFISLQPEPPVLPINFTAGLTSVITASRNSNYISPVVGARPPPLDATSLLALKAGYTTEFAKYNLAIADSVKAKNELTGSYELTGRDEKLVEYGNVQRKLNNMDPEVTKQLTAMEEEKRLNLNSIKMRYLLWRVGGGILLLCLIGIAFFIMFKRLKPMMNTASP